MKSFTITSILLAAHTLATPVSTLLKRGPFSSQCSVTYATLPPSDLAAPPAGSYLWNIAVGRGTQNYTCADSTSSTVPAAAGAVAKFFNSTCLTGSSPQGNAMASQIPGIAVRYPTPAADGNILNQMIVANHYFSNNTTPVFNYNTANSKYGIVFGARKQAVPAPNASSDIPWLLLSTRTQGNNVVAVYRVNTAGGVAPATCQGQPATFQVDYASEYWFYST